MKSKTLLNILGAVLAFMGITMVAPILISAFYNESDFIGFV